MIRVRVEMTPSADYKEAKFEICFLEDNAAEPMDYWEQELIFGGKIVTIYFPEDYSMIDFSIMTNFESNVLFPAIQEKIS